MWYCPCPGKCIIDIFPLWISAVSIALSPGYDFVIFPVPWASRLWCVLVIRWTSLMRTSVVSSSNTPTRRALCTTWVSSSRRHMPMGWAGVFLNPFLMYSAVIQSVFSKINCSKHPIAQPRGWDMGCLCEFKIWSMVNPKLVHVITHHTLVKIPIVLG